MFAAPGAEDTDIGDQATLMEGVSKSDGTEMMEAREGAAGLLRSRLILCRDATSGLEARSELAAPSE